MCTQKPPHDYSQQLYDKYREAFEDYINSTVSLILIFTTFIHCLNVKILVFGMVSYAKNSLIFDPT